MTDNHEAVQLTREGLERAIAQMRAWADNPLLQRHELILPLRPDIVERLKAEGRLVPVGNGWQFVWDLEDSEDD